MSRLLTAIYVPARIFLAFFIVGAMIRGEWRLALYAWVIRSALWWAQLPNRKSRKTGRTLGEVTREGMRDTAREHGLADVALTIATLPKPVSLGCRFMLGIPALMVPDGTFRALIFRGRNSSRALARVLMFGEDFERESAIRALAQLKPDGYQESLRPLLGDRSDAVRAAAEEALGIFGEEDASDPYLRLVRLPEEEAVPADLVAALRSVFEMCSGGERRTVIQKLGEHRGPEAVDWLIELIQGDSVESMMAIHAAEKIDDPRLPDALYSQVGKGRSISALLQLAKRGDTRIEPVILERLNHPGDRLMKGSFLTMLAQIPTDSARAELDRWTRTGSSWRRLMAAEALASEAGQIEPLRQLTKSWNPIIGYLAKDSLKRLPK